MILQILVVIIDLEKDRVAIGCANILAAQKKYAEAIDAFKQSIALKPDFAKAYCGLGAVYKESGDTAGAIKAYKDALAIDPEYPEVLNNLGVILKNKGELRKRLTVSHERLPPGPTMRCRSIIWAWYIFLSDV